MFKLSENQKYQIVCILKNLAMHDRDFNSLEAIRIKMAGLKMDLHASKIDEALYEDFEPVEQILGKLGDFNTDSEKKFLYQQCMLLLMADREINPIEKDALDQIRTALGIDNSTHEQIANWVNEGLEWEKRGDELVGGPLEL